MEIEERSRLLFMKYALPCAGTLVKRGDVKQEYADMLMDAVKNGKRIPEGAERIFKVALAACSLLAGDSGKKSIDEDVIRRYFLFGHDEVIGRRYEEMGDFDPQACRVTAGVVESAGRGFAVVRTLGGRKRYRADYCNARKGDTVVTHWDFIVEKTDRETAGRMNSCRKIRSTV